MECDIFSLCALTLLVGRQEGHAACKKTGCRFVGGDGLTGALHNLAPVVQLSPPPPSSFASINTGESGFIWKMAIKMERVLTYYVLALMVGALRDDARLTSVCLSRTSGLSREQRGIGRVKLAQRKPTSHVTR